MRRHDLRGRAQRHRSLPWHAWRERRRRWFYRGFWRVPGLRVAALIRLSHRPHRQLLADHILRLWRQSRGGAAPRVDRPLGACRAADRGRAGGKSDPHPGARCDAVPRGQPDRARLCFRPAWRVGSDGRHSRAGHRQRGTLLEGRLPKRFRHPRRPGDGRDAGARRRAPFVSASARPRSDPSRFDGRSSTAPVLCLHRRRRPDRGGLCRLSIDRLSFRQDRHDRAGFHSAPLLARHGGRSGGRPLPWPLVRPLRNEGHDVREARAGLPTGHRLWHFQRRLRRRLVRREQFAWPSLRTVRGGGRRRLLFAAGRRAGRSLAALAAKVRDARNQPDVTGIPPMLYLWIMLGSALGGAARYWFSGVVANRFGETFPWGTILVNVSGSFVIGFFATLTGPDGRLLVGTTARQFVMIGLCGGYTTFSSFSLQTFLLAQDGEWLRAGANAGLSLVLCLLAVWLGHILAALLNQMKGV